MRLDKFLKISRIIKRRTVAKEACEQGRVQVNGKVAKPGVEVKVDDLITVTFGTSELTVQVKKLTESCKKQDSEGMYEIIKLPVGKFPGLLCSARESVRCRLARKGAL